MSIWFQAVQQYFTYHWALRAVDFFIYHSSGNQLCIVLLWIYCCNSLLLHNCYPFTAFWDQLSSFHLAWTSFLELPLFSKVGWLWTPHIFLIIKSFFLIELWNLSKNAEEVDKLEKLKCSQNLYKVTYTSLQSCYVFFGKLRHVMLMMIHYSRLRRWPLQDGKQHLQR